MCIRDSCNTPATTAATLVATVAATLATAVNTTTNAATVTANLATKPHVKITITTATKMSLTAATCSQQLVQHSL